MVLGVVLLSGRPRRRESVRRRREIARPGPCCGWQKKSRLRLSYIRYLLKMP